VVAVALSEVEVAVALREVQALLVVEVAVAVVLKEAQVLLVVEVAVVEALKEAQALLVVVVVVVVAAVAGTITNQYHRHQRTRPRSRSSSSELRWFNNKRPNVRARSRSMIAPRSRAALHSKSPRRWSLCLARARCRRSTTSRSSTCAGSRARARASAHSCSYRRVMQLGAKDTVPTVRARHDRAGRRVDRVVRERPHRAADHEVPRLLEPRRVRSVAAASGRLVPALLPAPDRLGARDRVPSAVAAARLGARVPGHVSRHPAHVVLQGRRRALYGSLLLRQAHLRQGSICDAR